MEQWDQFPLGDGESLLRWANTLRPQRDGVAQDNLSELDTTGLNVRLESQCEDQSGLFATEGTDISSGTVSSLDNDITRSTSGTVEAATQSSNPFSNIPPDFRQQFMW